jgi:hypothetical protein
MLRLTDGEMPFELDDPEGDVGDDIPAYAAIVQDAASEAKYFLRVGGAAYAYQHYREALKRLIDMHTWRSEEAAKVLLRIQRQMMAEVPLRDEITVLSDLPLHLTN